jgi:hypothetical protein
VSLGIGGQSINESQYDASGQGPVTESVTGVCDSRWCRCITEGVFLAEFSPFFDCGGRLRTETMHTILVLSERQSSA